MNLHSITLAKSLLPGNNIVTDFGGLRCSNFERPLFCSPHVPISLRQMPVHFLPILSPNNRKKNKKWLISGHLPDLAYKQLGMKHIFTEVSFLKFSKKKILCSPHHKGIICYGLLLNAVDRAHLIRHENRTYILVAFSILPFRFCKL